MLPYILSISILPDKPEPTALDVMIFTKVGERVRPSKAKPCNATQLLPNLGKIL